ncbi:MAG: AraC family transcriptional regulator ligand-binding domain-containing protein [Polyangiales bacterium]
MAPRTGPTAVSALLAQGLLDAAEARGARRQALLAAAGCSLDERVRSDSFIDLIRFSRLIEAAVEQTGDPAFGLHWGEHAPRTNFGLVGSLALWAPSPRTALSSLTRFQGLWFQGRPVATFQTHGGAARVRFELGWLEHTVRRTFTEFSVVGTQLLVQNLAGRAAAVGSVTFDYAAPAYSDEYTRILGERVAFERGACSLELDTAQLDLALPQFNPRLSEAVLFEASCALDKLGGGQRCSALVREELALASHEVPSMDGVARKLGMSSRTLRRRLEQEGTAFPALVAEALRRRALQLLDDPRASVKEVAYALGFANPSTFHRAFKRWTGRSPSEVHAESLQPARVRMQRSAAD